MGRPNRSLVASLCDWSTVWRNIRHIGFSRMNRIPGARPNLVFHKLDLPPIATNGLAQVGSSTSFFCFSFYSYFWKYSKYIYYKIIYLIYEISKVIMLFKKIMCQLKNMFMSFKKWFCTSEKYICYILKQSCMSK